MAIFVSYGLTASTICSATNSLSVTPNTGDSGFCTATSFTGAGIAALPSGNYYFAYQGNYVTVNVTLGNPVATVFGFGCTACPCTFAGYILTATLTLSFNGPFSGGPTWTAALTGIVCPLNVDVKFLDGVVTGFDTSDCSTPSGAANEVDSFQFSTNPFILAAGNFTATQAGGSESQPANRSQVRSQRIAVTGGTYEQVSIDYGLGYSILTSGDTFIAGGVQVTLAVQPCTSVSSW